MKEQKWIIGIVVGIMAMAGIFFSLSSAKPSIELAKEVPLTPFGQYLKDNGVKFYGASWCPHCQNMKKELGDGTWQAVYIECAPKGTNNLTKECEDAKIEAFPTFVLKDGTTKTGEMPIKDFKDFVGYKDTGSVPEVATTTGNIETIK